MPRYELPSGLSPEEERAVIAALEEALGASRPQVSPWALAGRAENLRHGQLQVRHDAGLRWNFRANIRFARRGTR